MIHLLNLRTKTLWKFLFDQTTSPNAIDSSMNLENTLNKSMAPNSSFGISIASLENSYGFKMDLENFQSAKANIEVIEILERETLFFIAKFNNKFPA